MKRVLLDQQRSPLTAKILRAEAWDAIHVSELDLDRAEDAEILDAARQQGRICITLDHDFHAHLALTRADYPSVVFLRIQGLDAMRQANLIRAVWNVCERELAEGAAVSADGATVRVRRLPLR